MNLAIFGIHSVPLGKRLTTASRTNSVRASWSVTPRTLLERMETWLWQSRQRDLERCLAGCKDVFELEARLRAIERVPPHRRYE